MNVKDFYITRIGSRYICLSGVGKLFYQSGFPVSMSIKEFIKNGVEVSILHVADECLKNGWSAKTTINRILDDFNDGGIENVDKNKLITFCYATYDDQREMIYQYLYGQPSETAISRYHVK